MATATDILDELDALADGQPSVSVREVADGLGARGIGALLVVPASFELTPIGGVPGVPTFLALIVSIFAVQILLGREKMWLPGVLARRKASSGRIVGAVKKLRPAARWSDRHLGRHLLILINEPAPRLASLAILFVCLTVPALEFVPFASSLPMSIIMLFGLAMVVRDGRVMALAWIAFFAGLAGIWGLLP